MFVLSFPNELIKKCRRDTERYKQKSNGDKKLNKKPFAPPEQQGTQHLDT